MNALCFSVAAFPELPRWPPLASHCLWLSGKSDAGIKKGLRYRRTRSSRKSWVSGLQKRDVGYVRNAEHALHGYATRVIRVPEAHLEANA